MLGFCPQHGKSENRHYPVMPDMPHKKARKNVGFLSPRDPECWVFVPGMLGFCPRNVGFLSPECWVFVPERP